MQCNLQRQGVPSSPEALMARGCLSDFKDRDKTFQLVRFLFLHPEGRQKRLKRSQPTRRDGPRSGQFGHDQRHKAPYLFRVRLSQENLSEKNMKRILIGAPWV